MYFPRWKDFFIISFKSRMTFFLRFSDFFKMPNMVILVAHPGGVVFFDQHYSLKVYVIRNNTNAVLVKSKMTDYLPKTIKVNIPEENKNNTHGALAIDSTLCHVTAELCHIFDEKNKKLESKNKVAIKQSSWNPDSKLMKTFFCETKFFVVLKGKLCFAC